MGNSKHKPVRMLARWGHCSAPTFHSLEHKPPPAQGPASRGRCSPVPSRLVIPHSSVHTGLLTVPSTCQSCCYFWAFELAVPSAWKSLLPNIHLTTSAPSLLFKCHSILNFPHAPSLSRSRAPNNIYLTYFHCCLLSLSRLECHLQGSGGFCVIHCCIQRSWKNGQY